jgi:hypothetical protein
MSADDSMPGDVLAEPIVGPAPSAYDVTVTAPVSSDAGTTARPPGQYDTVVNFDESEVEPIVGRPFPTPYTSVVFDESEVEPIVGRPPTPYTSIVFDDTEVEPIIGRVARSPYETTIVFSEAEAELIVVPAVPSPYGQVVAPDAATVEPTIGWRPKGYSNVIPAGVITFPDAEAEVIRGTVPQRVPASFFRQLALPAAGHISFELSDAWDLPRPTDPPAALTPAELQVMSWLQAHQHEIADVERRRHVDRRAIAAAIAWEALKNPLPLSVRAVGPGKVHFRANVVHEVEAAGYLPVRTDAQRMPILRTPAGAIEYIGAIMQAQADIAASIGWDTRRNVPILANEYQGSDLSKWRAHLASKTPGAPLEVGNNMAIWAGQNIPYLEAAVGAPDPLAVP